MRKYLITYLATLCIQNGVAMQPEILDLTIISYEAFTNNEPDALSLLDEALHETGIVGIKGVPGYKEKVTQFIKAAQEFSLLPEEVKMNYAPNHALGETFLGYELGKEQFKRPDGKWVIDDLKTSYYAYVPGCPQNKWPREVNLETPFEDLGCLMSEIGTAILNRIGLIGDSTGIYLEGVPQIGRLLYYRKSYDTFFDNPLWCGAHFDHGLFTVLLPAFYFVNGEAVAEPLEAGLFIKPTSGESFKKVVANDPDVLLFQVGEFGQLATNDKIKATEHKVKKATGNIERYTMALFFDAPQDAVIHSSSILTRDERYGGEPLTPCSYRHWHEESFKRYLVKANP